MDVEYTVRELSVPAGSYRSEYQAVFKFVEEHGTVYMNILNNGNGTVVSNGNSYLW